MKGKQIFLAVLILCIGVSGIVRAGEPQQITDNNETDIDP